MYVRDDEHPLPFIWELFPVCERQLPRGDENVNSRARVTYNSDQRCRH